MLRLACLAAAAVTTEGFGFVAIGDWGGASLGEDFKVREQRVGQQMARTAEEINAPFVVNVGDNFYYCGVKSKDDPLFKTDFEDIFTQPSLQVPWISVLGNHDYGYSPQAQVEYRSPSKDRWVMPDRYFVRRFPMGGSSAPHVTLINIDTNPCISAYRSSNPSGWDPCSGKYGDCPGCKFHENIVAQNCTAQMVWFKQQLRAVPSEDWLVVVGHHPAHEINTQDFTSAMQEVGVDLYINGHTHELNSYTVDGSGAYITTGAGCMDEIHNKSSATEVTQAEHPKVQASHSHEYTWWSKTAGFTAHVWDENLESVTTKFISYNGTVIHSITSRKRHH